MPKVNQNKKLISTDGVRYMGSKRTLLPFLMGHIQTLSGNRVMDGFSGTTRVSQALRQLGYYVHSNDVSELSELFGNVYVGSTPTEAEYLLIQEWIKYLNALPGKKGFLSEQYGAAIESPIVDNKKRPYWVVNTAKADAIRIEIEKVETPIVRNALLVSLILAMDKVENTLGHQVAYLKEWAPRALNHLRLEVPNFIDGPIGTVSRCKSESIKGEFDIAYFDPPYGTNNERYPQTRVRYASYYHLWRTIIRYDQPKLVGNSLRPIDLSDRNDGVLSDFESTNYDSVYQAFLRLYQNIDAKSIVCSYSNKGKLKLSHLMEIAGQHGDVEVVSVEYRENIQKKLVITSEYLGDQEPNIEYLVIMRR